jgi:predicted AAA+ superfamily ATPase
VSRTEIRGKKVFEVGEKYYFEDVGLRNSIIGYKQNDINGIIENTVYNQLTRQGFDTKVGKLGDKEIDFVCVRHDETVYVQVAYLIPDKKTHDREFGNLLSIDDNCPKYVVSMDETAGGHYMGIRHLHLKKFLTTDLTEK